MDIFRDSLRLLVKRFDSTYVAFLCLSLLLTGCGGGGGPGEESDKDETGTTASKQSFSKNNVSFINSSSNDSRELLCQGQNILLCENFEWSSSLAYKASVEDWSLKGWQYTGVDSSGNFCNKVGLGSGQCALKWSQQNNESLDSIQKASYSYSDYGAGFDNVSLSWSAKWSAQWLWDAKETRHLVLESNSTDTLPQSFISIAIDSSGYIQLLIHGNEECERDELVVESDKSFDLQGKNLGQWQQFKLDFNLGVDGKESGVSLSVNDQVVVSLSSLDSACIAPDTVSFLANSYNQQAADEQNVWIDNVLIVYN